MSFLGWTRHRNQNPMIELIPAVWWHQLSLKDAKTISDCKCLCVLAFSTKSMRTPFVEDTSLLPNYINVPSHQFCSLNCNPPNDFDKMLTSYLTFWQIIRNLWIMQEHIVRKAHMSSVSLYRLFSAKGCERFTPSPSSWHVREEPRGWWVRHCQGLLWQSRREKNPPRRTVSNPKVAAGGQKLLDMYHQYQERSEFY